jgi:hypothetical protein
MEKYTKSQIAVLQIRGAINQIKEHNFASALTLAGAGNEILEKLCKQKGFPFSHTATTKIADKLRILSGKQLKESLKDLSNTRNKIKHHNSSEDEIVEADFFIEACGFISSALKNYEILFQKPLLGPEMDYWKSNIAKDMG